MKTRILLAAAIILLIVLLSTDSGRFMPFLSYEGGEFTRDTYMIYHTNGYALLNAVLTFFNM